MKVVIDAVMFQIQRGRLLGISRVWYNLINELKAILPGHSIVILRRKGFPAGITDLPEYEIPVYRRDPPSAMDADDAMLAKVCKELRADIFVSTYYTRAPGICNVLMIHDLIPEVLGFDLSQSQWVGKQRAVANADSFIAVSNNTKADLIRTYKIPPERITVACNGVSGDFRPAQEHQIQLFKQKYNIRLPYFLLVGNRSSYKNCIPFFNAFLTLPQHWNFQVFAFGDIHGILPDEVAFSQRCNFTCVKWLPDSEITAAYSGAISLVFPSRYEGFGLPVLEAMACGCPVITSNRSSLPEVGGDAALYVNPDSPEEIAQALRKVMNQDVRTAMIEEGLEQARKFSWKKMAEKTAQVLTQTFKNGNTREANRTSIAACGNPDSGPTAHPVGTVDESKQQIDVSIILATKDRAVLLDPMLASLKAAVQGITCELIVIEAASSDNTLDVLHKHGVENIYNEAKCLGPGKHTWSELFNFGFSKARGKWAMYGSDDIIYGKDCISRAVNLLKSYKDEVAGGIFFFKNIHARPGWDKYGIDFTFGPKLLMNYGLVKVDHFRDVGGLNEAYQFYCGDGDMCLKLYKAGKQLIPLPGCFIVHNNVLDASKQANAKVSGHDIQLYMQRWEHFVRTERPNPRRLLWQDDFAEVFNLPATLPKIDSAIEHFWHGLACYQYSMFEQAKLKFLEAIHSKCDHWLVLWYLAKAAFECGDESLATKAADAVLQLEPDFLQAKDLLTRLGSDPEQAPKPASTRIENDADASTVCDDVLKNTKVHDDSPVFDDVGFDNSDFRVNGEYALLQRLIRSGDIVFDIGANTGQWSGSVLAAVGKVHLHSFEPVANTFAVLKTNLGSSGVHLHDIAIADNNGPKTFYHYNQNPKLARMSSFYRRNRAVESRFNMQAVPISVQAQTLDSFCREHSIPHVDFIKIDTEGGEFDVLRGAAGLLGDHRIKMLQFEYGGTYPDAGITLQQVCRLLSEYGYVIFRILPDGLVHMANWRDSLENNRYSNYLAVSSKLAGNYTVMQNLPVQKTERDYDVEVAHAAPAPFAVTSETDVLSQLISARLWSEGKPLRLHLGCGKWHFDGYINIDYPPEEHNVVTHLGADLYADITKLNFPAHSVDEIRLHHVFEHFDRVTALGLLVTWHEWLKVDGKLHIETPDLIGSAKTLLSDASLKTKIGVVRHLAGDQADKWAFHTDHWFGQRFEHTLTQLGFGPVRVRTSSWPHEPYLSNVKVEAARQVHLTRQQLLAACDKLLLDSLVSDAPNELKKHEIWVRRLRTFLDETAASCSKAEHPVDEAVACNKEPAARNDVATETIGLIFSKDRPMQLAATIQSFLLHCSDSLRVKLHVLYKASNDIYRAQYDTLKNEFADITFIEETNFKAQTLTVISEYEYVLFLVDDNLFVKDFSLAEIVGLLKQNHNALGFSLRLGKNTTYSYARDAQVTLPPFWYVAKSVLKYDWTRGRIHFAYPLEVSSSIYRAADIAPLLKKLDFDNPNMLEGLMAANTQLYARSRAALLCYEQSAAFCNPLNIVQTVSLNRAGSLSRYSADSLAQMFDRGLRIDVRRYAGFVPNSPHQEVQLEFVKLGSDSRPDKPLVSVEMIAYNAQKYIAAAIDSVLAQTYKNFELLIIDDGSGDRTKEIIDSYSDSRIRYIHKPHKNRWSGTNVAIARANGQYIITVDSDDFIAPDYIEKMVACARRYPDVDYFYPACLTLVDQFGNPTGGRWDYVDFSDNRALPNFLFEHAYSPIPHPGSLKRKSLYQRVGGYEELENAADFVFLCRNSLKIRFKRVGDHSTYFYRKLSSSLSHKFRARNQITADILNEMVSIYPPEVLCPHIGRIAEPALRRQQYYKYLMETFYKHVHGHMVKYGDYFRRYGDYYKQQLLKMIGTRDNLSPAFGCDHAGHKKRSLICRR